MSRQTGLKSGITGVITGASSGIGRATAVVLAERYQARLVLNARNKELLEETVSLVKKAGGSAQAVSGDISCREVAGELIDTCLASFGSIDLLVNNAGLAKPGPVTDLTPDDWHYVFNINFFGPLYAIYAALPHFLKQESGTIVNISSVAGKVSVPGSVCYAASKFALTGLSEGLAAELYSQGVDVITVCPGWVRTEFFSNVKVPDRRNPTVIASQNNLSGWLMRNILSMSSHDAACEIVKACNQGGSREVILTYPAVVLERLQGLCPSLLSLISRRYPAGRS